jgi:hypothetical protein
MSQVILLEAYVATANGFAGLVVIRDQKLPCTWCILVDGLVDLFRETDCLCERVRRE